MEQWECGASAGPNVQPGAHAAAGITCDSLAGVGRAAFDN
jgi:hypothetical protein